MHITNQKGSWQGSQFVSTFTYQEVKVAGLINILLYKNKIPLNLLLSRQKISYAEFSKLPAKCTFSVSVSSSEGMTNWRCFNLCGTFCLVRSLFYENPTFKRIVLAAPPALPSISCAEQQDKIWVYQTEWQGWISGKYRVSHEWIGISYGTSPKLLSWYSNTWRGHNSNNLKIQVVPLQRNFTGIFTWGLPFKSS